MAIPNGYDLSEQISRTPFAQVWACQNNAGEAVVLKIAADEAPVRKRFERELGAMMATKGRHVMPILDYDLSFSWYAMPRASYSLWEIETPVAISECIQVLNSTAEGLRPLHAVGQVHRDLKPQNLLWLSDDTGARWVVADFGIVRNAPGRTTSRQTRAGGLTGSDGWAAPEQYADAHDATVTADVFSLGAIAGWLLTGKPPSYGHVTMPDDARVGAVIRRATKPNPADRYPNLDDFVDAFDRATRPFVGKVETLLAGKDWVGVGEYVLEQQNEQPELIRRVSVTGQSDVNDWAAVDAAGMLDTALNLLGDVPRLNYHDMDAFLSWCVRPLRALTNADRLDLAEDLAVALFGMTAQLDQFAPARAILDWLAVVPRREGEVMERALHTSESWEFFQMRTRDRFPNYKETGLVAKLRQE
ncbi:serine/threonine protein kinase [Curtobacterium sp. PvP017]